MLELRDKESKVVKMKRYEDAEKIKMKADLLEEFERNKLEAEVLILSSHSNKTLNIDASNNREERSKTKTSIIIIIGCITKEESERQK